MAVGRRTISSDVTEAINTISYRIEKTEADFLGHLQKVETKLEQIAELTRTVSLLQQQTNQQSEHLVEVRTQIREFGTKLESTTARIHGRIDEVGNNARDKIEMASKENEMQLKAVDAKANNNEKELKQWLNRGIGAWVIIALVGAAIQTGFYRWIDSIEQRRTTIESTVQSTASLADKHTQQIGQLIEISKTQQDNYRYVEKQISDLDKQLDQTKNQLLSSHRK